jgi:hypothetical protein
VAFTPNLEYTLLHIALPGHMAKEGRFVLSLASSTWRPTDHPRGYDYYEYSLADNRELGLAIGWDGFLREDCPDRGTLRERAKQECQRQCLHLWNEPCWSPLLNLYLVGMEMRPTLAMGPNDWRQLGPGWHTLERWPQGWMRWSSRQAEFYLAPGAKSKRLTIRIYTGEPALGKEVSGWIRVEWAADRLVFKTLPAQMFFLPVNVWKNLEVDLPEGLSPDGLLRVVIQTETPRIPALLIPGSQDKRELGLAVSAFWID